MSATLSTALAAGRLALRHAFVLAALASAGCAAGTPKLETADPHAKPPPRRPPGISVNPAPRLPAPAASGESRATLLVLSSPHALARARETVQRFFQAIVSEAPAELDELLADQAWLDATSGRSPAKNALRTRLAQLDFSGLRGVILYSDRDVEIYRGTDAPALAAARSLPEGLRKDEVFVRVRLAVSHAGKVRLFSDEMAFTLRPDGDGFRILRVAENTPVP